MNEATRDWLKYAEENYSSVQILLDSSLYNVCLQNIQQSIEKYLKSLLLEKNILFKKTHSVRDLVNSLKDNDVSIDMDDNEIDLIDSIYLPSKYPLGNAMPFFEADKNICLNCILILDKVKESVEHLLK